jgi:hypothetical protein
MTGRVLTWTSVMLLVVGGVLVGARLGGPLPLFVSVPALYGIPVVLSFIVVSGVILHRLPRHPVGWMLGVFGFSASLGGLADGVATGSALPWLLWVWSIGVPVMWSALALALLLFPTGRPPSAGWRWGVAAAIAYVGPAMAVRAVAPWPNPVALIDVTVQTYVGWPANPLASVAAVAPLAELTDPVGVVLLLIGVASLFPRWRRSTGDERQQLKWLGLAALVFALEIGFGAVQELTGNMPVNDATSELFGHAFFGLVAAAVPISIGLGIVRYRLYQIDLLLGRTLVVASLAAYLGAGYVLLVAAAGGFSREWVGPAVGLAITAGLAIAFDPLRARLRAAANRLVFGERATPYALMARFGADLGQTLEGPELLDRVAETSARAVRPQAVRVTAGALIAYWPLDMATGRLASSPVPSIVDFQTVVPVHHAGRAVGEIAAAGRDLGPADRVVLNQLAAAAAPALSALALVADLRTVQGTIDEQNRELAASRARLAVAAESERQRVADVIEGRLRELVAEVRTGLHTAEVELAHEREPDWPHLADQANQLVAELRLLSHGVLPRIIVDHGLGAALRALVRRLETPVTLRLAPEVTSARFPSAVETTVYLCCRAAVGEGTDVDLSAANGHLRFQIRPASELAGGLRDRVVALGGSLELDGPVLTGQLPLELRH